MSIPESDTLLDQAEVLYQQSVEYKETLNELQPRTTREQWLAWECLQTAANGLRSAAMWLARHDEKTKAAG